MSIVVGDLRASLGLDGAQFNAGLDAARSRMSAFRQQMIKIAGGIGATLGAVLTTRAIARAADEWSDLSSQVGNAVGSMRAAPDIMARIQQMARSSYSDLGLTTRAYLANSTALGDLGYATAQQLDYTEALNNALVISATRGQQATQVQDALSKAMATGKLSGDGLNTVLARGGRVAKAIADEMGVTVSGLRKLGAEGKITGRVIASALLNNLEQLRKEAGDMPATMSDGITLLRNSALVLVGVLDQTIGASSRVAEILVGIADGIAAIARGIAAHGDTVVSVMQTMAGVAVVVATIFATRYAVSVGVTAVKAMVSAYRTSIALNMALGAQSLAAARAGLAIKALSGAFWLLARAVAATVLGALVVAAGYLVGKFYELVQATGSFGAAMRLVADVGREAWDRLDAYSRAFFARVDAGFKDLQADAVEAFSSIVSAGVEFANRYIGIYLGAFEAVKSIWSDLPAVIGDLSAQAAQMALDAFKDLAVKIAGGPILTIINGFRLIRGEAPISGSDLLKDVGNIKNDHLGAAAAAGRGAAEAFQRGFEENTIKDPGGYFAGVTEGLRGQADAYREAGRMLDQAASRPMTAWEQMKALLAGTKDEAAGIPPVAGAAGDALDTAGGKGKKSISDLQKVLKSLREEWERLRATWGMTDLQARIWDKQREAGVQANSLQGQQIAGLMTQIDGMNRLRDATEEFGQTAKQAFEKVIFQGGSLRGVLSSVIAKLAEMTFTTGWNALWSGGGLGKAAGGILKMFGIGSYEGGGFTWTGPRVGGVDGRGGRPAILHPDETVIDHTKGGFGGGTIQMTASELTLTDDGRIMAVVRAEMGAGFAQAKQAVPLAVKKVQSDPWRKY